VIFRDENVGCQIMVTADRERMVPKAEQRSNDKDKYDGDIENFTSKFQLRMYNNLC